MDNTIPCPCGSKLTFSLCCYPYILGSAVPTSPEALMRSRYSAYATSHFEYIANTYASKEQSEHIIGKCESNSGAVSVTDIKKSSLHTKWCKLEIVNSHEEDSRGEVEFVAYYQHNKQFYAMHERSRFIKVQSKWLYVDGQMLSKTGSLKIGRNDNCLCGSGKKFKRCCQA